MDDDSDVDLLVHWKHHGGDQRTWESQLQLCEDVPVMVSKYVDETDSTDLTTAHEDCVAQLAGRRQQRRQLTNEELWPVARASGP